MVNQPLSRAFNCHSLEQGLTDQIPGQALPHGISHNISGKEILMRSYVQPAFVSRHIGYITHPYLIRRGNLKLLSQDIISYRKGMPGIGGSLEFPLLLAAYAELSPNSFDPANPHPDTMLRQIMLQLLRAVNLPGTLVGRSDLYLQP
jgi:hypothetical protein